MSNHDLFCSKTMILVEFHASRGAPFQNPGGIVIVIILHIKHVRFQMVTIKPISIWIHMAAQVWPRGSSRLRATHSSGQ